MKNIPDCVVLALRRKDGRAADGWAKSGWGGTRLEEGGRCRLASDGGAGGGCQGGRVRPDVWLTIYIFTWKGL